MNLKDICNELIKLYPYYEKRLNNHIKEYDGDILGHVFFGDDFTPDLIDMIRIDIGKITEVLTSKFSNKEIINLLKSDSQIIKKHCEFIEFMWEKGDSEVKGIVDVTILERLSDDREEWKRFGEYISSEFKNYINNDFLKNDILMDPNNTL